MSEQILIYFINFLFIYSIIKGIFKGGTSELISLSFLIVAFLLSVHIFDNTFYRNIIAIVLFFSIYTVGLFIAYLFSSNSTFEKITGGIMGIIKFFVFLTIVTILAMFMDSIPAIYKNNFFVYWIYSPSLYFKKAIKEKKIMKQK